MTFDQFVDNVLSDSEKKILELIAENFRQQSFFGEPWVKPKHPSKGNAKILYQNGDLQDGFTGQVSGRRIEISNSTAYASIHNTGGEISVTPGMKKFFWAMYYKATGAVSKTGKTKRDVKLTAEGEYWKSLALIKVGSKIKIPKRQFFGHHPKLDAAIEEVVDLNVKELHEELTKILNRKK